MAKYEWTKEDEQASNEAQAIRRSFKSTRGKTVGEKPKQQQQPLRKAA